VIEQLRQLFLGLYQTWQRLTASARINIAVAGIITALVVAGVVYFGARPTFVPLYTNLSLDDASAITAFLQDRNVRFTLGDGGTTVLVPSRNLTEMRVALREQNLPRTYGRVPGFELLDTQDMFASREMQSINYLRAVQGELTRQLTQFAFVNRAFVHIQPAREELFARDQQASEASVLLDVNRPLSDREIKAVLGMVSAFGGTRLNQRNISLTTTDGAILHSPTDDQFAAIASNQLEHLASHERYLKEKVEAALARMGRRGVVIVGVDLDWSSERVRREDVEEGAVISEMIIDNISTTSEGPPEGAPGAAANIPAGMGAGQTATTQDTESQTLTNFEPARTLTETTQAPGRVKEYRVAAFVEGDHRPVLDEAGNLTGSDEYVPLSTERLEAIRTFIAAAVPGVSSEAVVVFDQPISIDTLAVAQQAFEQVERMQTWAMVRDIVQTLAPILLLVVGLFVVRRFLLRIAAQTPRAVEDEVIIAELTPEEARRQEIGQQVERMTRESPDTAAAVLRTWISEED
jgi:flagellar M-ring protein FliF